MPTLLMHAIQEFYSTAQHSTAQHSTAPSGQVAEFHLGDTNDSSTVKTLTSVHLIISPWRLVVPDTAQLEA
jgi:hypothetical protein